MYITPQYFLPNLKWVSFKDVHIIIQTLPIWCSIKKKGKASTRIYIFFFGGTCLCPHSIKCYLNDRMAIKSFLTKTRERGCLAWCKSLNFYSRQILVLMSKSVMGWSPSTDYCAAPPSSCCSLCPSVPTTDFYVNIYITIRSSYPAKCFTMSYKKTFLPERQKRKWDFQKICTSQYPRIKRNSERSLLDHLDRSLVLDDDRIIRITAALSKWLPTMALQYC